MRSLKFPLATLLVVCSFITNSSFAQIDLDTLPFKHLEVGPYFTAGLSVFQGNVPTGAKTDVHFAFSAGALTIYSFHPFWGFGLGLGYESRGMYFVKEGKTIPNQDIALHYFSIQPSIKFKQFLLGINIGLPLSGHYTWNTGFNPPGVATVETDLNKDSLKTLIDIRISGLLPIVENDNGSLYFVINACYNLNGVMTNFLIPFQDDFTKPITKSPLPTLQLGLSYLFAPMGKTH